MRNKKKDAVIYGLFLAFSWIVRLMPLTLAQSLGKGLGVLCFHALGRYRTKAIRNIQDAYQGRMSADQARKTIQSLFENLGMNLVEFIFLPALDKKEIEKLVHAVDGFEDAKKELSLGRGLVVITGHLGNWELLPAYFGAQGYPITVVARDVRNALLQKVTLRTRESHGVRCISREKALRSCIEALKKNAVIGILADQYIDSLEGVFVDFFGRPAYTIKGPIALARLYDSPVVIARIVREGKKHRIQLVPFALTKTKDPNLDFTENTARYTKVLEDFIREYPSQWVWFHDRWRKK